MQRMNAERLSGAELRQQALSGRERFGFCAVRIQIIRDHTRL